jgi:murein DD-endopeptidase MepM/ murein hydrolase activator NlpD
MNYRLGFLGVAGALLVLGGERSIAPGADRPEPPLPTKAPLVRAIDLNAGDSQTVELCNSSKATVKLLEVQETRDDIRSAVRTARVKVAVEGKTITLSSGNYHLPQRIAGVCIDCPITRGYLSNTNADVWGLEKEARLRLWPADSPLLRPGSFVYPARQRWFASATQMANEPVFVDGGETPAVRKIYYHYGLDIGGAEALVEVVAATDGLVVSSGKSLLDGYEKTPAKPRYDVVYLLDEQGWYYRYSHLHHIDPAIKLGAKVKKGQKLGLLGKEGGSGGWSHLHFDITSRQPSGKWGIQEGYAFLWEAYQNEHHPKIQAVARPHHLAWTGQPVTLDGSRSWAADRIERFEWTFTDGQTARSATVTRSYDKPGNYSEILRIVDGQGRIDYDFAVVQVLDREHPDRLPPSIHAAYAPTLGIKPGDEITFKVRSFRTAEGGETWDFGDGSPPVKVKSDGNAVKLAKDGYAVTTHRYEKAGHYLVRVQHAGKHGIAVARLHIRVGQE